MKLHMHAVHFDADRKLLGFIQQKADKLDTFYDRILDGEVFLRLDKGEHSRENKVVEIKLNVPGGTLFVKECDTSFERAADTAVEALKGQIKKHKDKTLAR